MSPPPEEPEPDVERWAQQSRIPLERVTQERGAVVAWLECHRVMEVIHHSKSATKPATVIDKHRALGVPRGGGVDFLGSQWHQAKRLGTNDIALATLVAFGEPGWLKRCEAQKGL